MERKLAKIVSPLRRLDWRQEGGRFHEYVEPRHRSYSFPGFAQVWVRNWVHGLVYERGVQRLQSLVYRKSAISVTGFGWNGMGGSVIVSIYPFPFSSKHSSHPMFAAEAPDASYAHSILQKMHAITTKVFLPQTTCQRVWAAMCRGVCPKQFDQCKLQTLERYDSDTGLRISSTRTTLCYSGSH